jgi:hypothetical protein
MEKRETRLSLCAQDFTKTRLQSLMKRLSWTRMIDFDYCQVAKSSFLVERQLKLHRNWL